MKEIIVSYIASKALIVIVTDISTSWTIKSSDEEYTISGKWRKRIFSQRKHVMTLKKKQQKQHHQNRKCSSVWTTWRTFLLWIETICRTLIVIGQQLLKMELLCVLLLLCDIIWFHLHYENLSSYYMYIESNIRLV